MDRLLRGGTSSLSESLQGSVIGEVGEDCLDDILFLSEQSKKDVAVSGKSRSVPEFRANSPEPFSLP